MTSPLGGGFGGNLRDRSPSRDLDPGTGGVRDTYRPDPGSAWEQAEYAEATERELREPKKPLLTRIWIRVRQVIWGT